MSFKFKQSEISHALFPMILFNIAFEKINKYGAKVCSDFNRIIFFLQSGR